MALESGLDIAEVERRFWEINWSSDLDFDRFMREAHEAKQAGWAYDKGDFNPRLLSIAVAAPTRRAKRLVRSRPRRSSTTRSL